MIAVDTQILVYAHITDYPWHDRARAKVSELANRAAPWAIPMHCLVEFFANVTNPRLPLHVLPAQALAQVDAWVESPSLVILADSGHTWPVLRGLLAGARIAGGKAYDARIAAVCLEHGVTELWTNDRDFLRYPALRVTNPLVDIPPSAARERTATYVAKPARGGNSRARTKRR